MLDPERCWQAVCERDAAQDGQFVFAVRSTGIFCRPSCPARRPLRRNVTFYPDATSASAAGFRPCQRCSPHSASPAEHLDGLVLATCELLRSEELPLAALAARIGLSPSHLVRAFKARTGLTPRGWRQAHVVKDKPRAKTGGETLSYSLASCPLGWLLLAASTRGLRALLFGDTPDAVRAELRERFAGADLQQDDTSLKPALQAVLNQLQEPSRAAHLPLDIRGTAFQQRVWQALQQIPCGQTRSYSELAQTLASHPRAVARACASNPLGLLVPCHRVVGADGSLSGYRWGLARKAELLRQEQDAAPALP